MHKPLTYTAGDLCRLIADAKSSVAKGEPDAIANMCHHLMAWAGEADVDRTLAQFLILLLRNGTLNSISQI